MSTRAHPIEIVTIYSSPRARSTGTRIRLLGVISLIIAASWIDTLDGSVNDYLGINISITKLLDIEEFKASDSEWQDVHDWLGVRIGIGLMGAGSAAVGQNNDVAPLFGGPRPKPLTPEQITKLKARHAEMQKKIATLGIGKEVWTWANRLTGYLLALTGLLTLLTAARGTLKLHTLAGVLIILASLLTVAGIWAAINYGGMPADASLPFYVKIGCIQSAYGWVCLIAAKSLR